MSLGPPFHHLHHVPALHPALRTWLLVSGVSQINCLAPLASPSVIPPMTGPPCYCRIPAVMPTPHPCDLTGGARYLLYLPPIGLHSGVERSLGADYGISILPPAKVDGGSLLPSDVQRSLITLTSNSHTPAQHSLPIYNNCDPSSSESIYYQYHTGQQFIRLSYSINSSPSVSPVDIYSPVFVSVLGPISDRLSPRSRSTSRTKDQGRIGSRSRS